MVNTHALDVTLERGDIEQWIRRICSTTWLVCHTTNVEPFATSPERIAFTCDGGQGALLAW